MKLVPLSSNTYRTFTVCPWKAHAHQNLGFAPVPNPATGLDFEVRHVLAQVLRGTLTFDDAQYRGASREAADLITRALADTPIPLDAERLVEQYAAIDACGRLVGTDPDNIPETAVAHGHVDCMIPGKDRDLSVMVWRTGLAQPHDPFERHLVAGLLARALFPETRMVRFIRHNISTASRAAWIYTFGDHGSSVTVQGPRGRPSTMRDEEGPLVAYLRAILRRIEIAPARPTPGDHCTNWDGSPCQFLAAECPLGPAVPTVIDECVRPAWQVSSSATLRSIAFDPDFRILAEHASWAWNGVLQLEHFVGQLKKRLKAWAESNGPIRVGDDRYGWAARNENVVDEVCALQFLLDTGLPLETICKAMNVSKTSIERLPKEFHHIKQALLAIAVTERQGKRRFGLLER